MDQAYIWQLPSWPGLHFDAGRLLEPLGNVRLRQGALLARIRDLGFEDVLRAQAEILTEELVTTSKIEGKDVELDAVRSSVARRLGLPEGGLRPVREDRYVDGLVEVLLDATAHFDQPLTPERLHGWQAALFPTGYSGLRKIRTGAWRNGPMTVLSGPIGRETIHFEAPPAERVEKEMAGFLAWWEERRGRMDGFLRAGMAALWFLTIHPFEDGNGRIARALTDLALAQDDRLPRRYYSMSSQILREREGYYEVLEETQKGSGDITAWLKWFLACAGRSMAGSETLLARVLARATFWRRHPEIPARMNERQLKVLNRLLEAGPGGFEGGISTRKYAGLARTSKSTASRELAELVALGLLAPRPGGGRSASYEIAWS